MDQQFLQVAALLPGHLRRAMEAVPADRRRLAEELRLRTGYPPTITYPGGEQPLPGGGALRITAEDLTQVLEIATNASVHTVLDQMRKGFISVRGGHRMGLCGSCVMKGEGITNLRQISSLSIRIARALPGLSARVLPALLEEGRLQSTLILSPPGMGKTTLLRDLIRALSEGEGCPPLRVGVADERGELAAMWDGAPQMDLGCRTDVMDGCPKAAGLLMLLRGMNPQVLAADEITAPEDCKALCMAANCGVKLLATAHAEGAEALSARPLYRELLEQSVFRRLITIHSSEGLRRYEVTDYGVPQCR
ncbi:MAG: stage III sporulation protein AB [Pseudoflavonifractor sp.]